MTQKKTTKAKPASKRGLKAIKQENAIQDTQPEAIAVSAGEFESNVENSFFYTSDKFFSKLDNNEIFKTLCEYYPLLAADDDATVKKTFILLLNDDAFVEQILSYYNISIYDFFKLVYTQYSSLFKGPYLKKIKSELESKQYALQDRRATDY